MNAACLDTRSIYLLPADRSAGGRLVMTCLGCFLCSFFLGRPCAAHTVSSPADPALDAMSDRAASLLAVTLCGVAFYYLSRWFVTLYEKHGKRELDAQAVKPGLLAATVGVMLLLWHLDAPPSTATVPQTAHVDTPQHGGQILSVGDNHLELAIRADDSVALYLMGISDTLAFPITNRVLHAQVTGAGGAAVPVTLRAAPQPGDPAGQASAFVGQLPQGLTNGHPALTVSVPLAGALHQVQFDSSAAPVHDTAATAVVALPVTPAERALFLTPGGAYTAGDIAANGGETPSQKYQGLMANHHMNPKKGAYICPITHTQANAQFPWVVGGRKYLFCCPPCVAEFVKQAKTHPQGLRPPQSYIKR